VVVNIAMKNAPAKLPLGFAITNPARIALDFGATTNATGKSAQDINLGEVRGVNVVQAGERTRLVMNLKRPPAIRPRSTASRSGHRGRFGRLWRRRSPRLRRPARAPVAAIRQVLRNLDFRRGLERRRPGRGRPAEQCQVAVDVRQLGNKVQVDFMNTGLPETLRRRLDVTDFGTPVSRVTTSANGPTCA
jgi:type IV pilus assembly protein PilQ